MYSIVIPYRNRLSHLEAFVKQTVTSFRTHLVSYDIVVVHQCDDRLFNRGALINIGVKESSPDARFVITQDVDTIPLESTISSLYAAALEEKTIVSIYSNPITLGGIVKMHKTTYELSGGFPNNFWGWGAEDKALQNRAEFHKLQIKKNFVNSQPTAVLAKHFVLHKDQHVRVTTNHTANADKEYKQWPRLNAQQRSAAVARDGTVDTVQYKLLSKVVVAHDQEAFAKVQAALQNPQHADERGTVADGLPRIVLLNVTL
jgi:hypothetical protein